MKRYSTLPFVPLPPACRDAASKQLSVYLFLFFFFFFPSDIFFSFFCERLSISLFALASKKSFDKKQTSFQNSNGAYRCIAKEQDGKASKDEAKKKKEEGQASRIRERETIRVESSNLLSQNHGKKSERKRNEK